MIDRVSVVIDVGTLSGQPEDIRASVFVAVSPSSDEDYRILPQLFENTKAEDLNRKIKIKTKPKTKIDTRPHYFFSGTLSSNWANAPIQRISLDSSVNVTRFMQAQKLVRPKKRGKIFAKRPYSLALKITPDWWQEEAPLELDSNVIVGSKSRFDFVGQVRAADQLEMALRAILSHIGERLDEGADVNNVEFRKEHEFILRELEVYWEFSTSSPISLVDLLADKLAALTFQSRITARHLKPPVVETIQLSRSVMIYLSANVRLRIYSKTSNRIRIEVIFSPEAVTNIVGKRTAKTTAILKVRVDRLIEKAAEHVNWILEELKADKIDYPSPATLADLRGVIQRKSPNLQTALAIIEALRRTGRVTPDLGPDMQVAIAKLSSSNGSRVLKTVRPYSGCYGVTPRYRDALEGLRSGR